ncbi:MAG: hypothetical protein MUP66_01285 [Candidatus Nanohaloarchaeota archaeon QJJ-5]|nr:hypothetical protein [Candidatus Nanohaloarchaeota archaeon QJJ-5]
MGHLLRMVLGMFIIGAGFAIELIGNSIIETMGEEGLSNLPYDLVAVVSAASQGFKYLGALLAIISFLGLVWAGLTRGSKDEEEPEEREQEPRREQEQRPPREQKPPAEQRREPRDRDSTRRRDDSPDDDDRPPRSRPPRRQPQTDDTDRYQR